MAHRKSCGKSNMDEKEQRKIELQKEWYERNKDRVLAQKREKYHQNKQQISAKRRIDRVPCPLCPQLTFKRDYLRHHLIKRHNLDLCEKKKI